MRNLLDLLDHAATKYVSACCAVSAATGLELNFQDLRTRAEQVAAALTGRFRVEPGQHVALLLPNVLEFLPLYFGIQRAGAVAVPVNARLRAAELEFILEDSEAQALFIHPTTLAAARGALEKLAGLKNLVAVDFKPGQELPAGAIRFEDLLAKASAPPPRPDPGRDEVCTIIYTSGTTGRPKGAMLTHGNILYNVEATVSAHGLRPGDAHLLVVPLFHVTGLNTIAPTSLLQGGKLVVCNQIDPEDLIETIGRFGCTTFFGVPTTFYLLTSLKGVDAKKLATLRLICYSGAPMSPQTIEKLRAFFPGVELHNFFGLTETTSVSSVLPDDQAISRAESVGLPPPGLELRIVDDEDRPLPPKAVGELVIRGPSVLKGYYKRPEATAEALRGGWFHTGDTAYLDEEGFLFLQGRKKELIIVAGENVYPIEVENALCAHPAVQEAAAFGKPDKALGEVVHAAVVLRPGQQAAERDLKRHVMERLAAFKQPRAIRILDKLPRNASGKVLKRDL
ncbi:MAG: long-chain-fatty-acid--CoA ligase [Planctomycetota bacterium]|nr:long-chain-fatty-acid--CoA ligase [Planctomycetota bacterium]